MCTSNHSTFEPTVLPSQMAMLEFGDFRRAFWQLPTTNGKP